MARMPAIDLDIRTSVGIVRPGDKLVVAIRADLSMATRDYIKQLIETQLPGVEVVPVQADALIVYRAADPESQDR